ncbi:MAG: serine protease [Dehalococcoidia bacterium]|nr:serine protease [Dehalococcoidia bacterium]
MKSLKIMCGVFAAVIAAAAACGGDGGGEGPRPPQAPVETPERLDVEDLSRSVVMVAPGIYEGRSFEPVASGSATIIDDSGLLLTNFHVVDPDSVGEYEDIGIYVAGEPEEVPELTYFGGLAAWDEEIDLAVIRITRNRNGIEIDASALDLDEIRLGSVDDLEIGAPLTILGYPAIGEGSLELTKGSVSGFVAGEGRKQAWIKTDARLAPGNSGGGAFDERGYLVGVPSAVYYVEELGLEGSGRIRPIDLAFELLEEAKATKAAVIPRPQQSSPDIYELDLPLLAAEDIGPGFVLGEEVFLTNEDRASWYLDPEEAIAFYEAYGRVGGVRRVFDNIDAAERAGDIPVFIFAQLDLYETERGAAGATSGCEEFLDTAWEFVTAVGFEFYEPEYLSDPMLGDEGCTFATEEIVSSPGEPPLLLAFTGFRQGNVLAVVGVLTLEEGMSYEGLAYLAGAQSDLLAYEMGLVAPPRQPPAPAAPPPPASPAGYSTPEEAIGVYMYGLGLGYSGDCYWTTEDDIGSYCSMLAEDRGMERLYLVGLAFSEAEAWILLEQFPDGSWAGIDDMAVEYDGWGNLLPCPW